MSTAKIKELEVCCSTEWLRDHVLGESAPDGWEIEAADALYGELLWRLRESGFEPVQARGQRQLCHGWNGANTFTHKIGPVGTFESLTEGEIAAIEQAIEKAVAAAVRLYHRRTP